jgi:Ca2+-binding RTX toxin-like protein
MGIFRGTEGNDDLLGDDVANGGDLMNGFGGDDKLSGRAGNDNIHGDAGNDKLFGGEGNDSLDGGLDEAPTANVSDSDVLDGGGDIDTATYAQVQHGVDANLATGFAFSGGNIDQLISIENLTGTNFADTLTGNGGNNGIQGADGGDTIDGGGGNDRLSGNGGNDTILGGSGADILIGSLGVDKLTGGANTDTFQYFAVPSLTSSGDSGVGLGKRDVIVDFQTGTDKLDLHAIDAKEGAANSGNQDFSFIGGDAFFAAGQVRVVTEGANTVVQLNTDGDLQAESELQLTGHVDVKVADFIL